MDNNFLRDIENSKFGTNKYYLEIIKEFIDNSNSSRIVVKDDLILVKASDRIGSKEIYFKINDQERLIVKVNRNTNLLKFQDIIVYNSDGIMLERTNTQAEIKKDINDQFKDKENILLEEFDEIGKFPTIYTGKIFNVIRMRNIKRSDNSLNIGKYSQRTVSYDENGLMKEKILDGTFNILQSDSISSLEFPDDKDITITKEEEFDDRDNKIEYPYSRTL